MGVAAGDVNNDGYVDLFVTEHGRSRLLLNNGDRTFRDISKAAGIDNPQWGVSAAMFDFDRDGWLDIVAVNYVNYDSNRPCMDNAGRREYCGPNAFAGTVTRLFRNTTASRRVNPGGGGAPPVPSPKPLAPTFTDVTISSGLAKAPGNGLGVFCGDFDGDRWADLLIANDGQANHLWINRRDGTFAEEALIRGIALNAMGAPEANMGVAVGDVNADGLFDIFITHLTDETHTLWAQGPRGFFRDQTVMAGLARPKWRSTGFGTLLADFDHDGHLDLAVVNGRVKRDQTTDVQRAAMKTLGPHWGLYAERNQLFAGGPQGRFRDISEEQTAFCGTPRVARGVAAGDIDNDGDLDLLVTFIADRARLYRNIARKAGHWLMVRAVDPAIGRDAYGAEIIVRAGGKSWTRWANPGYSYVCSNDPRAHFGLGPVQRFDAIEVIWPDGAIEMFPGGAVDRHIEIRKGQGRAKNVGG
jgi:hypothetical protein